LHFNIQPNQIIFLPPKTIPKTSSGKLARNRCKKLWLNGQLPILTSSRPTEKEEVLPTSYSPLEKLKKECELTGKENLTLFQLGLDSLEMVSLIGQIKNSLSLANANQLAQNIDIRLFHNLTIAELFNFMDKLLVTPQQAIPFLQKQMHLLRTEQQVFERKWMERDRHLPLEITRNYQKNNQKEAPILLTGGTGFLGPYLLDNLLRQTKRKIYVLVRAKHQHHAKIRLRTGFIKNKIFTPFIKKCFQEGGILPICGDLAQPNLGLSKDLWNQLSQEIDIIYHNGALVNYLQSYEALRPTNVLGTHELLKLATTHHLKEFNYISTTFIFGWSIKPFLLEEDSNKEMEGLDFGYSQSKWVAEQLVIQAFEKGLSGRIFRPALITPSQIGNASSMDITLMLFAFMINHSVSCSAKNQMSLMPVDIVAQHIIGIAKQTASINKTFHLTADYTNLPSITQILSRLLKQDFELVTVHQFTATMTKRCTPRDPIYPLLDFFVRSADCIAAMEFKRYEKVNYEKYLKESAFSSDEVVLEKTIMGILQYLQEAGIIEYLQTQKTLTYEHSMDI